MASEFNGPIGQFFTMEYHSSQLINLLSLLCRICPTPKLIFIHNKDSGILESYDSLLKTISLKGEFPNYTPHQPSPTPITPPKRYPPSRPKTENCIPQTQFCRRKTARNLWVLVMTQSPSWDYTGIIVIIFRGVRTNPRKPIFVYFDGERKAGWLLSLALLKEGWKKASVFFFFSKQTKMSLWDCPTRSTGTQSHTRT